jgi:hypothetical protein
MDLATIINTILGTIPVAIVIISWMIKMERRVTRIETILNMEDEEQEP